jgi:hypothetical protein
VQNLQSCARFFHGCFHLVPDGTLVRQKLLFQCKAERYTNVSSSGHLLHQLVRSHIRVILLGLMFTFFSVPNFILAFIPAQINADTLNTMTAFAVRGAFYLIRDLEILTPLDGGPVIRRFPAPCTSFIHG